MKNLITLSRKSLLAASLGASALSLNADDAFESLVKNTLPEGKVNLDVRARWEKTDLGNRDGFDGITVRTRLGYTTAEYNGFTKQWSKWKILQFHLELMTYNLPT